MDQRLFDALQVRFVKLRFTAAFLEDSVLPRDKVSAVRGGMGEMLLRMNCVRDRQCETCDFEAECIVQKIMYSKFEIKPAFVTTGGSVGYVLECENYQEEFKAGDRLDFYLLLFGKTIIYFYQIYQALSMLGEQEGLGKHHARFKIVGIRNMEGMPILEGKMIDMGRFVVHRLYDYILFRTLRLASWPDREEIMMIFDTPLTLKYKNEFQQKFQIEAILSAIRRRIYMLDCFEGISTNIIERGGDSLGLVILFQEHQLTSVSRFSNRKNEKMILSGLRGHVLLGGVSQETLELLIAGELIHIGKNSSFGFGRYHLKFVEEGAKVPDRALT